MTDKPTVYLAGPIMFADDGGHGWRDSIINEWPDAAEWINPLDGVDGSSTEVTILPEAMIEDYDAAPDEEVVSDETVVEEDKALVRASDAIFVGYPRQDVTWGTPQEQIYAYARDITTVTWHGDLDWIEDCSPWLRYHSEYRSPNRDNAVEFMRKNL